MIFTVAYRISKKEENRGRTELVKNPKSILTFSRNSKLPEVKLEASKQYKELVKLFPSWEFFQVRKGTVEESEPLTRIFHVASSQNEIAH